METGPHPQAADGLKVQGRTFSRISFGACSLVGRKAHGAMRDAPWVQATELLLGDRRCGLRTPARPGFPAAFAIAGTSQISRPAGPLRRSTPPDKRDLMRH